MQYIDADSHVYEVDETWDYLPRKLRHRRPVAVTMPSDQAPYMGVDNSFWLVDGRAIQWTWGRGTVQVGCPLTSIHANLKAHSLGNQSLMDVPERVRELDRMGVDVQVVYPTLFLVPLAEDDELEVALTLSYNRWIESRCAEAPDRLKWVAILPLRDPRVAVREIARVKRAGAVGLVTFGTVNDRMLHAPEFEPVWAAAAEAGLPVAVHVGWSHQALRQMCDEHQSALNISFTLPLLVGFFSFLGGGILERHPKLKVVFLEGGAGWIPWFLERMTHYHPVGNFFRTSFGLDKLPRRSPEEYVGRVHVTCEAGERLLPQVIEYLGEDNIMTSEDMPHFELREGSLNELSERKDVSQRQIEKILLHNPAKFYGIKVKRQIRAAAAE